MWLHISKQRLLDLAMKPELVSEQEDAHIDQCQLCLQQFVKLIKRHSDPLAIPMTP
jgi:hypothetical protein